MLFDAFLFVSLCLITCAVNVYSALAVETRPQALLSWEIYSVWNICCVLLMFIVTEKTLAYSELSEKLTAGCGYSMTQHANYLFSSVQHKNLCKNKWKVDCNKNAWNMEWKKKIPFITFDFICSYAIRTWHYLSSFKSPAHIVHTTPLAKPWSLPRLPSKYPLALTCKPKVSPCVI